MGFLKQGHWKWLPCPSPRVCMSACIHVCVCMCACTCVCMYLCVHPSQVSPNSFHYSEALQVCAQILSAITNVLIGNQLPVPRAYCGPLGWASTFCINRVAPTFRLRFSEREILLEKKAHHKHGQAQHASSHSENILRDGWVTCCYIEAHYGQVSRLSAPSACIYESSRLIRIQCIARDCQAHLKDS